MFHSRKRGFTVVELMIVMVVIGVLAAMLFPALQSVLESSRATKCKNNLNQLGLALISASSNGQMSSSMYFISTDTTNNNNNDPDATGQIRKVLSATKMGNDFDLSTLNPAATGIDDQGTPYSFFVQLLPYIGQDVIQQQLDHEVGPFDEGTVQDHEEWFGNVGLASRTIPLLLCPTFGISTATGEVYGGGVGTNTNSISPPALTQYKAVGASTIDVLLSRTECLRSDGQGGVIHPWKKADVTRLSDEANTAILFETKEEDLAVWVDGIYASIPGIVKNNSGGSGSTAMVGLNVGPQSDEDNIQYLDGNMVGDGSAGDSGSSGSSQLGNQNMTWGPSSNHGGLVHHLMGGRVVRAIDDQVSLRAYRAVLTRNSRDNIKIGDLFEGKD